ncbi:MFS transporter [Actinophytocola sp.]|uniref:MFS transporter n=1 Tax=Actinophytocola sp. TaxID=1872138 RepID=UPI002D52CF02|nr:MFS transporter [Actinophytocola sp.]HYQ63575.1 MFS transporter [Actinophytocola sp.]
MTGEARRSRLGPDFLRLWLGQGVSHFGSEISLLAIPTLAILVYHATPFEASVIGALEVAPFTLFSLPAGPLADRLPRRAILIACDVGRALAVGLLVVTYFAGLHHMWLIYCVSFLVGTFTVFFDITFMSFVPLVVTADRLLGANSRLSATKSTMGTAGPSAAGLLIQAFGPVRTLLIDAVSYLVSAVAILLVRVRHERRTTTRLRLGVLLREIREGLAYVWHSKVLARVALVNALCDFGQSIIQAVYLVFLYNSLHLSPGVVGFVLAVSGVASVLGAVLLPRVVRLLGFGRTLAVSILVGMGVELLTPVALLGLAVGVLMAINAVGGLTNAWYDVNQLTYRQRITPDHLQGRVHATMRMTFSGPRPFGYLLGGVLGTAVGVAATVFIGALVATLGALVLFTGSVLRLRSIDDVEPDSAGTTAETTTQNTTTTQKTTTTQTS